MRQPSQPSRQALKFFCSFPQGFLALLTLRVRILDCLLVSGQSIYIKHWLRGPISESVFGEPNDDDDNDGR